jgi:hypothetical protein
MAKSSVMLAFLVLLINMAAGLATANDPRGEKLMEMEATHLCNLI